MPKLEIKFKYKHEVNSKLAEEIAIVNYAKYNKDKCSIESEFPPGQITIFRETYLKYYPGSLKSFEALSDKFVEPELLIEEKSDKNLYDVIVEKELDINKKIGAWIFRIQMK